MLQKKIRNVSWISTASWENETRDLEFQHCVVQEKESTFEDPGIHCQVVVEIDLWAEIWGATLKLHLL